MNNVSVLKVCLLIIFFATQANAVTPRGEGPSQSKASRADAPFNPCRTKLKMSSMRHLKKEGISLLSSCALKLVPLIEDKWGSAAEIISFVPKAMSIACVNVRVLYALYADAKGRLRQRLVQNASQVYDTGMKILTAILSDTSLSFNMCTRHTNFDNAKQICYQKNQLLRFYTLVAHCIQETLKDTMPEYADATIFGLAFMLKTAQSNGLYKYLAG